MKKENSEKILHAAMKVFSKKGYHGGSISDIAKEAKVSKALFYHYFKRKSDLLVLFAKRRLEDFFPLAVGMEKIKCPQKRLNFLVDFVLDELVNKTDKLRFINMLYLTEDGVLAIEEAMNTYKSEFAKIFQAERKLFLDLGYPNPDEEATYMRSVLQGISLEYMLGPSEYPLKQMKEKLLQRYCKTQKE